MNSESGCGSRVILVAVLMLAVIIGAAWLVVALVGVAGIVLLAAVVAMFGLALAAMSGRQQRSYAPPLPTPDPPMITVERPRRALPAPEPGTSDDYVQPFVIVRRDVDDEV